MRRTYGTWRAAALLILGLPHAPALQVSCIINRWASDHHIVTEIDAQDASRAPIIRIEEHEWVECKDQVTGRRYILDDEKSHSLDHFKSGDTALVNLTRVARPRGASTRSSGGLADYPFNDGTGTYAVAGVAANAGPVTQRVPLVAEDTSMFSRSASPAASASDVRTLLTIRVAYQDVEPACDEACLIRSMWGEYTLKGVEGSSADIFRTSSYGFTDWPNNNNARKIVTVQLEKPMPRQWCQYSAEGAAARAALSISHPNLNFADYRHIEYILPQK
uniref:Uncharacterized protein n=4 Tax=Chrysotila carterae TaxID=13221 RepID=A0A7S4BJM5_CHRCT|mmetsp:Transcript_32071/g.70232  ORF Transcript_32071/g.70232 Transcript_32071/m.70232 type:complete len:276 (-) Transcript_32071:405-1232(-)